MSLQFIAGRSGSGKSHYIYSQIIKEAQEDKNARFFVCVPDQFTMQTQKDLVSLHPSHCIMNIDVLSFNRLAARVFDETGFNTGTILEDMGKTLLVQKVIWDHKRSLPVLGRTLNRPGGADEMKSLVSEFMQYRVAPSDLETKGSDSLLHLSETETAAKGLTPLLPPLLERKLQEIKIVYGALKEKLEGKYLAAEEVCEALSRVIGQSEMVRGATFVFDSFTGFVPVQMMVIRELLKYAKDVKVVVTAERSEGLFGRSRPSDLFHMSHQMAKGLACVADEERIEVKSTIWICQGEKTAENSEAEGESVSEGRFKNSSPLAFLEANIFRKGKEVYDQEQEDIRIVCADNKADEIAKIAAHAARLVRTKGYQYRDIAVICADIHEYGRSMQRYFEDCGIPCFLDEKHTVLSNPFVQFIKGAADLIADNFSYDSVFAYLRSGFSSLSVPEIDRMENYVLAAGIQGLKKYRSVWTKVPKRFSEEDVIELNTIRERFIEEVDDVAAVFKVRMSPVGEKTKALYRLAVKCSAQQKLKEMETAFGSAHEKARESEYAQIYKAVIDFFDKLVDILGEERIGTAAYAKLIEAGFTQMKLGLIPTGPDEILIGDIERSRVKNVKVCFFAGLNDGLVPKRAQKGGLLSENDRDILKDAGMELAPSERENMFRQRFYLYTNLTLASEKIILSYKKADEDGTGAMPSYLIGRITRMIKIPDLTDEYTELETKPGRRAAAVSGLQKAMSKETDPAFWELFRKLKYDSEEETLVSNLERGIKTARKDTDIDEKTARAIYDDRYSVTRLQLFANCAFAHFLKYGLNLQERQIYEMGAADIGSIFHEVIRHFFLMADEKGGMKLLSDTEAAELTERAFNKAIGEYNSTVMLESARNLAQTERMKMLITTSILAIRQQVSAGEFETAGIEEPYRIGKLTGTIDRYDICRIGDVVYVRVIDYKSGKTEIDYTGMYYGLQIQLPVYLNAALEKAGEKAKAAGIYYLGIKAPLIKAESMDDEVGYDKFLKEMRFDGLSLDDPAVVQKQDGNPNAGTVLPIRLKKNGDFYANSPVISEGDFRLIERYTNRLVEDLEAGIRSGRAAIAPVTKKPDDEGHCKYCEFRSVCAYDPKIPGYVHKLLQKYDKTTICRAMSERM